MFGARHPSTAIGPGTLGPNIELTNKDRGRVSRRRVHDTGGTFQRSDSKGWTPQGSLCAATKT